MRQVLARGSGAVVAADAVARNADVIEGGRQPGHCRVAVVTGITTGDMCRVFAGRGSAVVTGTAAADDLRVIDSISRRPNDVVMAIFADIAGLHVGRTLAGCLRTIVTINTIAGDVDVIEVCR